MSDAAAKRPKIGLKILFPAIAIACGSISLWISYKSQLSQYPIDAWWWEGTVGANHVSWDGEQDLLTSEGYYLVLTNGPAMKVGDKLHILQATNADGGSLTFHCLSHDRSSCYPIDLVVTFPLDTRTLNQGSVPAKDIQPGATEYLGAHSTSVQALR
ncbi:TPA: hypothetical protein VDU83_002567 [Pseudomonas aeruginosa]|nr:hypothetical protein [Pseudomonas aeruginosa]